LPKLKPLILYGASPRASLSLTRAAKARAFLDGRGFATPQDVKAVGFAVLRHRVLTSYEAEAERITSEKILRQEFDHVLVPERVGPGGRPGAGVSRGVCVCQLGRRAAG